MLSSLALRAILAGDLTLSPDEESGDSGFAMISEQACESRRVLKSVVDFANDNVNTVTGVTQTLAIHHARAATLLVDYGTRHAFLCPIACLIYVELSDLFSNASVIERPGSVHAKIYDSQCLLAMTIFSLTLQCYEGPDLPLLMSILVPKGYSDPEVPDDNLEIFGPSAWFAGIDDREVVSIK